MKYAPIAIFAYNRPQHTASMIDSLLANDDINDMPITVYCDGPKQDEDPGNIEQVRHLISTTLPGATIKAAASNAGLANSIIAGVTEQCELHNRVIVIEDDLVLSPRFLEYMNCALDYYEDNQRVMHISGYLPPVSAQLPSSFFFREPNPCGWATWKRAWDYFEYDSRKLAMELFEQRDIGEFNQGHTSHFWEMLCKQYLGEVDSWAIRWYATVFKHNGLALYPGESLVNNIGFDGSGRHSPVNNKYDVALSTNLPLFYDDVLENKTYLNAIRKFKLNGSLHQLSRLVRHYTGRKNYLSRLIQQ